jgi:hypothetical protein
MENGKGLKRYDSTKLPDFFEKLPREEQLAFISKMTEHDVELRNKINEKIGDSKLAEHDMANILEMIQSVETENKIINIQQEIKTGSGKVKIDIKGGDRKFIIPLLAIISIVLLALLYFVFE